MHYFVTLKDETKGPYTLSQLRSMWDAGILTCDALYWSEGMPDWQRVESLLAEAASLPPSPPLPAPAVDPSLQPSPPSDLSPSSAPPAPLVPNDSAPVPSDPSDPSPATRPAGSRPRRSPLILALLSAAILTVALGTWFLWPRSHPNQDSPNSANPNPPLAESTNRENPASSPPPEDTPVPSDSVAESEDPTESPSPTSEVPPENLCRSVDEQGHFSEDLIVLLRATSLPYLLDRKTVLGSLPPREILERLALSECQDLRTLAEFHRERADLLAVMQQQSRETSQQMRASIPRIQGAILGMALGSFLGGDGDASLGDVARSMGDAMGPAKASVNDWLELSLDEVRLRTRIAGFTRALAGERRSNAGDQAKRPALSIDRSPGFQNCLVIRNTTGAALSRCLVVTRSEIDLSRARSSSSLDLLATGALLGLGVEPGFVADSNRTGALNREIAAVDDVGIVYVDELPAGSALRVHQCDISRMPYARRMTVSLWCDSFAEVDIPLPNPVAIATTPSSIRRPLPAPPVQRQRPVQRSLPIR